MEAVDWETVAHWLFGGGGILTAGKSKRLNQLSLLASPNQHLVVSTLFDNVFSCKFGCQLPASSCHHNQVITASNMWHALQNQIAVGLHIDTQFATDFWAKGGEFLWKLKFEKTLEFWLNKLAPNVGLCLQKWCGVAWQRQQACILQKWCGIAWQRHSKLAEVVQHCLVEAASSQRSNSKLADKSRFFQ